MVKKEVQSHTVLAHREFSMDSVSEFNRQSTCDETEINNEFV